MGIRSVTSSPGPRAAMNAKSLPGLHLSAIFEAGLKRRIASPNDLWHDEPHNPKGWHWHASQLGACPRRAILTRAGYALDGITMEAMFTFDLGSWWHEQLEKNCGFYAEDEPRFTVLATEQGGYHPDIPLAARCDLLFRWEDQVILSDLKTESPFARRNREAEALSKGQDFPYKWPHRVQLAATALVMEGLDPTLHIDQGRVLYLDKSSLKVDQVPCPITDGDRQNVRDLVADLEAKWETFTCTGQLPVTLTQPDEIWLCKPRSETEPRGKYCEARSVCQHLAAGQGLDTYIAQGQSGA